MGRGNGPEIMKAIKAINPEWNAQKYYQANAVRQDFAKGRTSQRIDALNTAIQHLDVFDDLGKALQNKDTNAINRVMNYVSSELGHPEVTDFNTAAGIVADEVVKSVVGSGAVYDRASMQQALSSNRAPEQLAHQKEVIEKLMAGQVGSLGKRWSSVDLPKDEFYGKLLPETTAALEKYLPKSQRPSEEQKPSSDNAAPPPPSEHEQLAPDGTPLRLWPEHTTQTVGGEKYRKEDGVLEKQVGGKWQKASGGSTKPGGGTEVTKEQYDQLPKGAAYTIPGDPTVRYKQ
jgi:hypothetical protein